MKTGWRAVSVIATGVSLVVMFVGGVVFVIDKVARKVLGGV